ncbi:MAG: Gfo/Idh/MocA family oxidoreductase [Victivallaceae bacterium]|nr:Gfo/Idh/MocA family oxidoreductase [Victivallaceae bacterium]
MKRKLRMGMVGGGPGAFIGEVHRKAARLDGKIEVAAGAFDIDPVKSRQMGEELKLAPSRVYGNYQEMLAAEAVLPANERIDFVSVTTPNNWHFPIAKAALETGFHVMCEKPMTMTVAEAMELKKVVEKSGKVFGLMHTYPGYPMVKLAKDLVKQGKLGKIRRVVISYVQGWLAKAIEKDGQMQASWRTDPKQSGAGGCVGDIGTHAANLAEYITGSRITDICADLNSFVEGRLLDDDGNCLLRMENGIRGVMYCSQIAVSEENNLSIWVYGTEGGIEWHQVNPNQLVVKSIGKATEIWERGSDYVNNCSKAAARSSRIPAGHPEGYLEAFANHYSNFADTVLAKEAGEAPDALMLDFPGVDDGIEGMVFIGKVVESAKSGQKWIKL